MRTTEFREQKKKYDVVVSRAVTALPRMLPWLRNKFTRKDPGSIICLKGGNLGDEIGEAGVGADVFELNEFFQEEFYETKKLVFISSDELFG